MGIQRFWVRDIADVNDGISGRHVDAPGPAGADGSALSLLADAAGQTAAMEKELNLSLSNASAVEGYFKVRTWTFPVGFLFWEQIWV